ncbi:MAG: hypothetical protein Q4F00_11515 [bacterium]|nr:hypothetical protein [bacterium]
MNTLTSWRWGLFGSSRAVLTLGLMMARRDWPLLGICPDLSADPQAKSPGLPAAAHDLPSSAAVRALHSTLLLGCPVYGLAEELLQKCSAFIAASDMAHQLTAMTDKPVIAVSDAAEVKVENANAPCPHVSPHVFSIGEDGLAQPCNLRIFAADEQVLSDMRQVWEYLQPAQAWSSDAGVLTWEQAWILTEPLFADKLTA